MAFRIKLTHKRLKEWDSNCQGRPRQAIRFTTSPVGDTKDKTYEKKVAHTIEAPILSNLLIKIVMCTESYAPFILTKAAQMYFLTQNEWKMN